MNLHIFKEPWHLTFARNLSERLGYGPKASARVGAARRTVTVKETASQKVIRVFCECDAIFGK